MVPRLSTSTLFYKKKTTYTNTVHFKIGFQVNLCFLAARFSYNDQLQFVKAQLQLHNTVNAQLQLHNIVKAAL